MKTSRIWLLLMVLALAVAPFGAFADDAMPEELFTNAKEALSLMSYGEYAKALDLIAFSSNEPTEEDFKLFAKASFTMLEGGVQKDVAVACLTEEYDGWLLAVPLWEPNAMDIETFVLHSTDGQTFDNYTSTQWSFIEDLLKKSSKVIWHDAYEPGQKYIFPD